MISAVVLRRSIAKLRYAAQFYIILVPLAQNCDRMITLRAYGTDDGPHVVDAWYALHAANANLRATLDARMDYLRQQERNGWLRGYYDVLRNAAGIGEVRFKENKIQHRALGFFGPQRNEFTFLFFATKTNRFEPRNAIDLAAQRKMLIDSDPRLAREIKGRWGQ